MNYKEYEMKKYNLIVATIISALVLSACSYGEGELRRVLKL